MKKIPVLAAPLVGLAAVLTLSLGMAGPGSDLLYGTSGSGGGPGTSLLLVDRTTGLSSTVGAPGFPAPALGALNFQLYAGSGGGGGDLFTINANNGAASLIADSGLGTAAIGALDAAPNGTMYASINIAGDGGTGSDHLATVDVITGLATVIGPYGSCTPAVIPLPADGSGSCTIEGMEAIAFDSNTGVLYGAVSARAAAGAPGLYTINVSTGAASFLAPILDAAGAPPSGGVVSLQFACDGTLYGGTATAIIPEPKAGVEKGVDDGGFLVTIERASGLFAFVGGTSATGGQSLAGLAFRDECSNVGVPTMDWRGLFVLIGLVLMVGAAGLWRRRRLNV